MSAAAPFERMRFKRIVGRAWFTLEQRFFFVVPLALVTVAAPRLAIALTVGHPGGLVAVLEVTGLGVAFSLITVVFAAWAARTVTADVRHEEASSEHALAGVFRRYLPLALTVLLVSLGWLIGFVLLIIPGIIWSLATCVAIPAAINEDLGPRAAIRRSLDLTRRRRGQIFGYSFLALLPFTLTAVFFEFVANDWSFPSPEHAAPLFEHWLRPAFDTVATVFLAAFNAALYEELLAVPAPPPPE